MKLHLPKKLTAALLAAVAATGAHAITTSTTTYADGTVFNGDIWTWNNYSNGTLDTTTFCDWDKEHRWWEHQQNVTLL